MRLNETIPGHEIHPVAAMRKKRKMSLRELAEATGLTAVGLSHIEVYRVQKPHIVTQRAIAEALACRVEDLFPSNGHKNP